MGLNELALSGPERQSHQVNVGKILENLGADGVQITPLHRDEISTGVMRDIQARRLPPNTRVPRRRDVLNYIGTVGAATGSTVTAIRCLLSPGSWTSSGGTHLLAEEHHRSLGDILEDVHRAEGRANFLEVGAGYAGLHRRDSAEDIKPKGIGALVERFRGDLGTTMNIHLTNLSSWHTELPVGVHEHAGFIGSTLGQLTEEGVNPEDVDVIYSQCAAYFDIHIDRFVAQAARLLRRSERGGYLIFNGKTEQNDVIMAAAAGNGLQLVDSKVIGGMNGTLYIFKKV